MMAGVVESAKPLIDPIGGIGPAVEARRWVLPLLVLSIGVSFSGASFASRWDAGSVVIQQLERVGELQKMTEQELSDKIQTTRRLRLVGGIAKGILGPPAVLLPIALVHLLFGICALRQFSVTDAQMPYILPSSLAAAFPGVSPVVQRLLSGIDLFNIWSAVLLGLGFSAASGMQRGRAIVLGLGLYAAYVGVFLLGLPGLMGRGA